MTASFDPYHKWLGIPPAEQPPHHYRLLGVAKYERDPDVIQNAADRQMAHLRVLSGGQNTIAAEQILNQVAAAKLCLLNEQKRAAYDRQLQAQERPALEQRQASLRAELEHAQPPAVQQAVPSPFLQQQGALSTPPGAPMRPLPIHPTGAAAPVGMAGMSAQRKARKKKAKIRLVGHLIAPLAGLVAGYAVLCAIGPQYDFLHLVHQTKEQREESKTTKTSATARAPRAGNPRPAPRPTKRSSSSTRWSSPVEKPGSGQPPQAVPETSPEQPSQFASDDSLQALAEKKVVEVQAPRNPLWRVGKYAVLPRLERREPSPLFPVALRAGQQCRLTLITSDASAEGAARLVLEQPQTDEARWRVVVSPVDETASAGSKGNELAEFYCDNEKLSFRWTAAAATAAAAGKQLRESIVHLQVEEYQRLVQLSEPHFMPPVPLELANKVDVIPIALPAETATDDLQFEITRLHPCGPTYRFAHEQGQCPLGQKITIELADIDGAKLKVSTLDRGDGPSLTVAAEYRLPGHPQPFELTLDRVNAQAQAFTKALDVARRSIPVLQSQGSSLQSQLRSTAALSVPSGPAGAAARVAKARRISALQTELSRVARKLESAEETVPEMERNLTNPKVVGNLGNALRGNTDAERTQIHFCIYRPLVHEGKELRLVVAETKMGLPAASPLGEPEPAAIPPAATEPRKDIVPADSNPPALPADTEPAASPAGN